MNYFICISSKKHISLYLFILLFSPIFSEDFSSGWKRSRILLFGNAEKNYQVGKWFYKNKDYNSALEHLLKSLKKKESIDAYKLAAESYVNTYKFEEAQKMVEGALYLSPNSYDLQKLKNTIITLKHSRSSTLSEDLNKIAKEHKKTVQGYDNEIQNLNRRKSKLSSKYNSDKNKLEKKFLNERKSLDKEYNNRKRILEQEYSSYLKELNQEKSKIEQARSSFRFVVILSILCILAVIVYIYKRFNSIETKHNSLDKEKKIFEGQRADHQMKIDLELSKVRTLKNNINSKKSELDNLKDSLYDKEKYILHLKDDLDSKEKVVSNLKQDLEKEQREIKKEWDRINSAKMKNKTKRKQSNPYTVLDLPKGTTDQKLIKKHWKKMSIICHPDKIASMHPDLRNLAQELMKDVNQAYDSLKNN